MCGRAGSALADAGSGLIGWRHLAPVCATCAGGRPVLALRDFSARLDGPAIIEQPDTTVLVPAGHTGEVDRFGNLLLRRTD